MSASSAFLPSLLAAAAAVVAAVLSFRSSAQANRVSARKVDVEDHRAQMDRLQQIITEQDRYADRLRSEIERLGSKTEAVQSQLAKEQDVSNLLRNQIRALQGQVFALEQLASAFDRRLPPPGASPPAGA